MSHKSLFIPISWMEVIHQPFKVMHLKLWFCFPTTTLQPINVHVKIDMLMYQKIFNASQFSVTLTYFSRSCANILNCFVDHSSTVTRYFLTNYRHNNIFEMILFFGKIDLLFKVMGKHMFVFSIICWNITGSWLGVIHWTPKPTFF